MKHLPLLALLAVAACASTEPPVQETTAERPARRRRRRRPAADDAGTAASNAAPPQDPVAPGTPRTAPAAAAGSFGSPVVSGSAPRVELSARWLDDGRVVCDGETPPQVASTQSPYEPTSAMIVRSFAAVEREVIACAPPTGPAGRFAVRVRFSGRGAPQEISFPEGTAERDALCVGRALCGARMPAFRAVFSTVPYEFLVRVAAGE